MTREEFTSRLPEFTLDPLPVKPPFVFNHMSARVFPLRASLDALQQVCDGYLNIVPPKVGYFRAAAPYVLLMVIDYGQLEEAVARIGWFAQLEVFFGIPVEWYQLVNGQWVFHDWAMITPYIFVDDDFSVPMGRTVYGFPKILARVTKTESHWIKDPNAPVTLARVETTVFPDAYSGTGLETRKFLEVNWESLSNVRIPFDPTSPITPWGMASNLAKAVGGFARDAMWMAQAMRIFPVNPGSDPAALPAMMARLTPLFAPGGTGILQNSLNLKQFRRSDHPTGICYQALTNGRMKMVAFNAGGLLGEEHIVLGDLSGGHSIKLYDYSSLPIARMLGLEVHRQWRDADARVAELKPVMPFWMDLDLKYAQGQNLAWRIDDGVWRDETGEPFAPEEQPATAVAGPDFNSTVSSPMEEITGPFRFSGTTIRVLPLLADKDTLQKFLKKYLNKPLESRIVREDGKGEEQVEFEVWARPAQSINQGIPIGGNFAYVYLTASSFGSVTSKTNNVGNWAKYELAFMIPVKWKRKGSDGEWKVVGLGLVPAFTFVDTCIAAISRLEVQGIQASTANFVRPESVWLSEEGELDPKQTLLRVDAEVLPALGVGQTTAIRPVIQISRGDLDAGLGDAPDAPWKWAEDLRHELGTKKAAKQEYPTELKTARALAIELLGNQTPVALYTLKQFRDVADPEKACYESLVRVCRQLTEVTNVREIEDTLAVRIYDYPTLKIVEELGIQAMPLEDDATGIVYSAQGIRPFYIRATVDEPLGERLLSRSGTTEWTLHHAAFDTLLSDDYEGEPRIMVDLKAETLQDQMDPSRTSETMYQARERWEAGDMQGIITAAMARKAFEVADPQIVIESVLSREWSNFDPNARWRKGRSKLLEAFSSLPEGGYTKPFAEAEMYRRINNLLAAPPGAVAAMISEEDMLKLGNVRDWGPVLGAPKQTNQELIENLTGEGSARRWREEMTSIIKNQREFTSLRLTMEQCVDVLASVAVLGLRGYQEACRRLNQPVPTPQELFEVGKQLLASITAIQKMSVVGEPSPHNNLDTLALAGSLRLADLLAALEKELSDEIKPDDPPEVDVEVARAHGEEFRQLVDLARRYCEVQYEALLNKLSRAYQKPDFCVRRDAVGAQRDLLLPLALSWDEAWYYGDQIKLA
ncbi:MAG TPA: acetoacetate decarboxylase family protein [Bryobacteraceae bacterium]|nr:acetoacetate decarboxylase family protein [Bryobacteraceae bacterium]